MLFATTHLSCPLGGKETIIKQLKIMKHGQPNGCASLLQCIPNSSIVHVQQEIPKQIANSTLQSPSNEPCFYTLRVFRTSIPQPDVSVRLAGVLNANQVWNFFFASTKDISAVQAHFGNAVKVKRVTSD